MHTYTCVCMRVCKKLILATVNLVAGSFCKSSPYMCLVTRRRAHTKANTHKYTELHTDTFAAT